LAKNGSNQGRNPALTVLLVPNLLDSGAADGAFADGAAGDNGLGGDLHQPFTRNILSHMMYELNDFRKSTPSQNRQLIVHYW